MNNEAAVVTAERVGDTCLSDEKDRRLAERQRLLPSRNPSLEPSHDEAGSRSDDDSDDEPNKASLDKDDEKPRPIKRKRPSSYDGPTYKKRKHRLQKRSTS